MKRTQKHKPYWSLMLLRLYETFPTVGEVEKSFSHLHLALFFIFGRYYEVVRRFSVFRYIFEKNASKHGIHYANVGRFIMIQIVFSAIVFAVRIIRVLFR